MIAIFPFNNDLFDSVEIRENTKDPISYLQRFLLIVFGRLQESMDCQQVVSYDSDFLKKKPIKKHIFGGKGISTLEPL